MTRYTRYGLPPVSHPSHSLDRSRPSASRCGLSLLDVIVLIGVCVLLALLFVPATRSARIHSRKLECLNNIRHVGLAIHNAASGTGGVLPPLSTSLSVTNSTDEEGTLPAGWPVVILPAIDATALLKNIKRNAVIENGVARVSDRERIWLQAYTCPYDVDSFRQSGGLSYVLNAGFISRNLYYGDPNREHRPGTLAWGGKAGDPQAVVVHGATGVFWHANADHQSTLDDISDGDGQTTTLMVIENLQAGNWYDADTARISFGYPVTNTNGHVPLGKGQTFESPQKPLNTQFPGGTLATAKPQDWIINRDLKADAGTRPRPSSNHRGGVNVVMCDGSGRFLSENLDPHVYLRLMTPNGVRYGEGEIPQSSY